MPRFRIQTEDMVIYSMLAIFTAALVYPKLMSRSDSVLSLSNFVLQAPRSCWSKHKFLTSSSTLTSWSVYQLLGSASITGCVLGRGKFRVILPSLTRSHNRKKCLRNGWDVRVPALLLLSGSASQLGLTKTLSPQFVVVLVIGRLPLYCVNKTGFAVASMVVESTKFISLIHQSRPL